MRMAGGDPQSAVAGCRLDPSNKQTTFQKSGYQWRHTTRSGRRKGPPHSQSFPTSAFRRRVTSQSALRDYPSGSSFDTDLDSRMGMKRIQPSDDFDQRVRTQLPIGCGAGHQHVVRCRKASCVLGTALPDYGYRDRIETTLAAGVEIA